MSDDDHSPKSDNSGRTRGAGFTAFGEPDRRAERRGRRRSLAGKVAAGVLVLGAVAGVAAVTSGGSGTVKSGHTGVGVVPGVVPDPAPPQVVMVTAQQGYAFYGFCHQAVAQGCAPALSRTLDGVRWDKIDLPAPPVDSTRWLRVQANSDYVMIASQEDYVAVLATTSNTWTRVRINTDGANSQVPPGDFLVGDHEPMLVVNPKTATAVGFLPPPKLQMPGVAGGALVDGMFWLRDASSNGLSPDQGVTWNAAPLPNAQKESPPLAGTRSFFALLTGPDDGATTGQPGAGGNLPAEHAYFSTDYGRSWKSPTLLTGTYKVNGLCTVYLDNATHDLLGVSADGKSLLTLTGGDNAFEPAKDLPDVTPSCLQSQGALVWGATADEVVLRDGSSAWRKLSLKKVARAVATPSPTPSAHQ